MPCLDGGSQNQIDFCCFFWPSTTCSSSLLSLLSLLGTQKPLRNSSRIIADFVSTGRRSHGLEWAMLILFVQRSVAPVTLSVTMALHVTISKSGEAMKHCETNKTIPKKDQSFCFTPIKPTEITRSKRFKKPRLWAFFGRPSLSRVPRGDVANPGPAPRPRHRPGRLPLSKTELSRPLELFGTFWASKKVFFVWKILLSFGKRVENLQTSWSLKKLGPKGLPLTGWVMVVYDLLGVAFKTTDCLLPFLPRFYVGVLFFFLEDLNSTYLYFMELQKPIHFCSSMASINNNKHPSRLGLLRQHPRQSTLHFLFRHQPGANPAEAERSTGRFCHGFGAPFCIGEGHFTNLNGIFSGAAPSESKQKDTKKEQHSSII